MKDPDFDRYKQLLAEGSQTNDSSNAWATSSPHASPSAQQAGFMRRDFMPSTTVNGGSSQPRFQTPYQTTAGSTATPVMNAYDPLLRSTYLRTTTNSAANPSPATASIYENRYVESTPTPQNVNGKRKKQDGQSKSMQTPSATNPRHMPPEFRAQVVASASPLPTTGDMQQYGYIPTTEMMHRNGGAWNGYSSMMQNDAPDTSTNAHPTSKRVRQQFTPSSTASTEEDSPASSGKASSQAATEMAATDVDQSNSNKADPMHQLAFQPDLYVFQSEHLFFLTVSDMGKAQGRGFKTAIEVYAERMKRPNILTTDINLAWIPGPGCCNGTLPWQPICGTAAYIGAVRGDLKLKFASGEKIYVGEQEIQPDQEIDIPMLHSAKEVLWNKVDYCRTEYAHPRPAGSDAEKVMYFMPSQAEWSPQNLPPSAAILEPIRCSKTKIPFLVDKHGMVITDANGQGRRAFDHVLPAHIPSSVEGWLIAAWLAEDPRLQWKDIEAHLGVGKETVRLRERYAKYRDSVVAMTRDALVINRNVPTKTDLKTVQQQEHEKLAGNSWWFVDLASKRVCQSKAPMKGLAEGLAVYPLPIRRKLGGKYSKRVRAAQDVKKKERSDADCAGIYEAMQEQGRDTSLAR